MHCFVIFLHCFHFHVSYDPNFFPTYLPTVVEYFWYLQRAFKMIFDASATDFEDFLISMDCLLRWTLRQFQWIVFWKRHGYDHHLCPTLLDAFLNKFQHHHSTVSKIGVSFFLRFCTLYRWENFHNVLQNTDFSIISDVQVIHISDLKLPSEIDKVKKVIFCYHFQREIFEILQNIHNFRRPSFTKYIRQFQVHKNICSKGLTESNTVHILKQLLHQKLLNFCYFFIQFFKECSIYFSHNHSFR